jgi:glycosyltransferase involved in cell wall biosynthesis
VIGLVIPAHDEGERIGAALRAARRAAAHPALAGEEVRLVVVLDSCVDGTADVVARHGARQLALDARNVGIARAAGAAHCLEAGARWLAFTDADTRVAPGWLAMQLAEARAGADAVCGTVGVHDWKVHGGGAARLRERFARDYMARDGHRHVHGANLGVSAAAYLRVGGFAPLACGEDVALVAALEAAGARIAWSARPRVTTSARTDARARGGFGDTLLAMAAALAVPVAAIEAG